MAWRFSSICAKVGQTIGLCRLSNFLAFTGPDRPRKAMVCPTRLWRESTARRKVAADQRGHGIGVAIDTYTTTDVESRREAVTRLEVALKDEEGTRNSKGSPRQGFRGKQGKGEFGGRS